MKRFEKYIQEYKNDPGYFVALKYERWKWVTLPGLDLEHDVKIVIDGWRRKAMPAVLGVWRERDPKAVERIAKKKLVVTWEGGWRGGMAIWEWLDKEAPTPDIPEFDREAFLAGQHPHIAARTTGPGQLSMVIEEYQQGDYAICKYANLRECLKNPPAEVLVFFASDWPPIRDFGGYAYRNLPSRIG